MAKWDLSKLPEGRKPLPDEWFREHAQMQERIKELEAENKRLKSKLAWAVEELDDMLWVPDSEHGQGILKAYTRRMLRELEAELEGEKDE